MAGIKNAAVIGTGLIGGSLGLALKQMANLERVTGYARSPETLAAAAEMGAIDEGFRDSASAAEGADIVFICTPISAIVVEGARAIRAMSGGAILTDVGSVKRAIVDKLDQAAAGSDVNYVGGHPMSGSEQSGVDAARADLFVNAPYILTPTEQTDPSALSDLHELLGKIGARIFTLNPDAHDRVIAAISHLPHVLSASLVNVAAAERSEFANIFKLAAGGFYDMTRIAAGAPALWVDICLENRGAVSELISQYKDELETFSELLREGDADGVRLKLENARAVRQDLPRLKTEEMPEVFELTVLVPNRPKVLSEITLCVADLGVNIEDIQIVHSTEADGGFLKLAILGSKEAARVAEAVIAKGYVVTTERRLA